MNGDLIHGLHMPSYLKCDLLRTDPNDHFKDIVCLVGSST